MPGEFSAAAGIKPGTFSAAAGLDNPSSTVQGAPSRFNVDALTRAQAKLAAGQSLTAEEANAYAMSQASGRNLTNVGNALQPFFALSDITKGLLAQAKGDENGANRGAWAALSHLTWGAPESKAWKSVLPGLTGARANGVTGMELLKGTKYDGNALAALAVEVFADPSMLLFTAGAATKATATTGRLASLEKLARTPEGAQLIRDALTTANKRGDALLRASDEITGVPAVARGVANSPVGKAVKAAAGKLADTQLPGNNAVANAIRREGGGTWGDALATPDVKKAIYSPEQLARDEFRDATRLGVEDYGKGVKAAALEDAQLVADITKGLSKTDAAEVNRLLGVFTTTTKPAVAQEALRKLGAISARAGRDLEPAFVTAVKATDRVGQVTLGPALKAQGLPAVLDPTVTKAIQDAQTGADLVPLVGKYKTAEGRPRPILMTQYTGRADVPKVIQQLADEVPTPAAVTVDAPQVERTLTASITELPPAPARPIEPVGVQPKGEPPLNPASSVVRLREQPVTPAPERLNPAAPTLPASEARSPAQVLQDIFSSKADPRAPLPAAITEAPLNTGLPPASAAPTPPAPESAVPAPTTRTPAQVIADTLGAPAPRAASDLTPTVRITDPVASSPAPSTATPPAASAAQVTPTPEPLPAAAANPAAAAAVTPPATKTPAQVIQDVLSAKPDPYTALPSPAITRTAQDDVRALALPEPAPERTVTRAVPTTYRTVEVDANALDWSALPDESARRSVLNSIEGASNARILPDAQGVPRLDRPNLTVPLDHPVISRYFANHELMAAQRQGTTLGERTITRKEQVPDWFNPREGTPLDVQRAAREDALRAANDAAYPNELPAALARLDAQGDTTWVIGGAYVSYDRLIKPDRLDVRAATNSYAQRVAALSGTPPTPAELFQYRLALARYRQAVNLRNMNSADVARHIHDFYRENPAATLYEGVLSTARAFNLGQPGARHLQQILRQTESGFTRQMSTLERLEFAQDIAAKDLTRRGTPGGTLVDRLKRNPEQVSQEFEQVFAQDINALKLLDEQVRTRTAAIVRAQTFRQYRDYLTETGQLITQKKLAELRAIPEHRLTPDQLEMRRNAATALSRPGAPSGWKVMDRNVEGYFNKGDVVPWWAYFDLFGASGIDDVAVSAAILNRGGLNIYDRLWSTQNAMMLGSPSSIINDQIGQLMQMATWGVTPDAVIEGIIRRATASPTEMAAMRASGLQSATLEANIGANREALSRLAQRLDGDTDMTRTQRVVDAVLRFRERGTGIDPTAMTGVAGVVADAAHLGSGYLFRLRSAASDLQRESLYFHRIALGDTPKQAAAYANEVLLDMRLVPAYARVVRRYWPFFNWIAMSGPRSIITVLRRPAINSAIQRIPAGSDTDRDGKDTTRRILARDGGYINLGVDERNGTRLYLDPRNWDPTNTIPQLLDWSGTKVGAVGLPWWAQSVVTVQWGQDRFGRNIYADLLDGGTGGFTEAYRANPKGALITAGKFLLSQFQPSYAPGSPRAQAFVRSVLATAQLPDDGSKDISIARMLTTTPQGRAYLTLMQNGSFALIERDLKGTRDSPYSDAAPSMLRAAANYLVPIRAVNPHQQEQGTALQAVMLEKLRFQEWLSGERKKLQELEAGGATRERIRQEEDRINREAEQKGARLDYLDSITR